MMYRRFYLVACVFIFLPVLFFGQSFLGLQTGKTLGIYNLDLQPAAIAGQNPNVDIQLFGLSATLESNYLSVSTSAIKDGSVWSADGSNYTRIFPETLNGKEKNMFLNSDFLLPSLSVKVNPNRSFALSGRLRSFSHLDKVGEPAARFSFLGLDIPEQFGIQYNNDRFRFSTLSYVELGLAWAEKVYENGPHRIMAGARFKFLSGLAGAYLYANRLEYSFDNAHILNVHEADMEFAHSIPIEGIDNNFNPRNDFDKFNLRNTGLGADLGAIYEYRPDGQNYKARVGLSILDLGSISFEQSVFSQNFSGSVIGYDLNQLNLNGVRNFDSTLNSEFEYQSGGAQFRMALPTVVSLQADFRLQRNVYVSVIPFLAMKRYGRAGAVHQLSNLAVTPRFEGKWWGVGIPFSLAGDRGTSVGATVRVGPVVAGSANLFNFLLKDNIRSADVHFGFRIPLSVSKKDKTGQEELPPSPEPESKPEPTEKPQKEPKEKPVKEPKEKPEKPEKPDTEKTVAEKKTKEKPIKEPVEKAPKEVPDKPMSISPEKTEAVPEIEATPEIALPMESKAPAPVVESTPLPPATETAAEIAKKEAIARAEEKARAVAEAARIKREEARQKEVEAQKKAREQELLSTDTELYQDRDNDGIADKYDQCPDVPGPLALAGCPEKVEKTVVKTVPKPVVETEPVVAGMDYSKGIYSTGPLSKYLPYADYDHDGVVNEDDRCPESAGPKSRMGCPEEDPRGDHLLEELEIDAFERIYFDSGSDHLTGNSRMVLNRVSDFLKSQPEANIQLVGHADDIGSDSYNDDLSQRRSESAKKYLVAKGISEDRLSIEYFGKRMAVVPNRDEAARKKNRRVEIVLVGN
ncbi:MAG: DUF5723 family protein [Bacteroidia bacterium]